MGSTSGFPIDLVLFGMIAAFLVLRLRSILGRRTGFERPPEVRPVADLRRPPGAEPPDARVSEGPIIEGRAETPPARAVPDAASPIGQALAKLHTVDRNFDPAAFLAGAEAAFRIIVGAFAAGSRDGLRPLLSTEMFAAFDAAITEREQAKITQHTDIKGIHAATIEGAELTGTVAAVTVRFVSDQVSYALAPDQSVASGHDAVTEITDVWTFERDLSSRDPSWRLIAARSA